MGTKSGKLEKKPPYLKKKIAESAKAYESSPGNMMNADVRRWV